MLFFTSSFTIDQRSTIPVQRALITLCLWTLATTSLTADDRPTAADADRLRGEVVRLLGELDSDRFEVRRDAAERLEELVAKPELGQFLAGEFHQVLVRSDVSYEVRWRLTRWSKRLPAPEPGLSGDASPEEIDQLLRQLDDNSYAVRLGAAQRIEWLSNNPKLVGPLLVRLKRRLADPAPGAEARQQLEAAWQRVRGLWLLSDPASSDFVLPAISNEQIGEWVDAAVQAAPSSGTAYRELLDALARDEYVPQVTAAIQARLTRNPAATARLQELLDWTKPALVAEFWHGRHQLGEQHLLVGVPTLSPGAARHTYFDRIDDCVAHYVEGNSLTPDTDYPVGVAFPHPSKEDAFFCLVNLPTPRRRMAYGCRVQIDESKRLAALSRRTLDRFLADKHPLTELEVLMLGGLDPTEASRFAGRYFLLLDDGRLPNSNLSPVGGRSSRFGMMCSLLALDGTKDALPGLTDAIAKNAFLPPTTAAPYRWPWIAAFSIAARNPWPDVDVWLADHMDAHDALVEGDPSSPDVGATAAALLLSRHGGAPDQLDLQPTADPVLTKLRVDGYRFTSDEARKKVKQWWEEQQQKHGQKAL